MGTYLLVVCVCELIPLQVAKQGVAKTYLLLLFEANSFHYSFSGFSVWLLHK